MHKFLSSVHVGRSHLHAALFALSSVMFLLGQTDKSLAENLQLKLIQLPPGFDIETFANDVPNARAMTLGTAGTLFVGSRSAGNVYALIDRNRDMRSDELYVIAEGLQAPSGVAFKDGALYVSAVDRIFRFDNIESHLENPPEPVTVTDMLPSDRHHGWKFIDFGPDEMLYVPVGAPCNVCIRPDPYAGILRIDPKGSTMEMFASQ